MDNFPKSAGIYEQVLESGQQRYTLAVPAGYSETAPVPMVIALHWGGQVTPFYSKPFLTELIEPALRDLGALIAAPDCQRRGWSNPASERDVLNLLQRLQASYNIDAGKIVLVGFSMGGKGVWYLAARNQEKFAAAIPMAAPPIPVSSRIRWQMPLYVIHSRSDEHFPLGPTAAAVQELQSQGNYIEFMVLEGITHYNAGGFIEPLRAAVPWLRAIWEGGR